MKPILVTFYLSAVIVVQCGHLMAAQDKIHEASQAALWESNFSKARSLDTHEKFKSLLLGLRNMGLRASTRNHSAAIDEIFRKIQNEYLSTPGHAQFFVDEIERERAALDPRVLSSDFDRFREFRIEQALVYLPSPETVKVLGNYLSDDRDFREPRKTAGEKVSENLQFVEVFSRTPANSHLACSSLSMMGLRNTGLRPASESAFVRDEDLAKTRAWWEEVKSGKRTFSFKGQSVEYRFKPDGTWDTIPIANPPDDAPKPVSESIPANTPPPSPAVQSPATRGNAWTWILIAMIGGLLVVAWAGLRSRNPV